MNINRKNPESSDRGGNSSRIVAHSRVVARVVAWYYFLMKKAVVALLIVLVLFLGYYYSVRKGGISIIPRFWEKNVDSVSPNSSKESLDAEKIKTIYQNTAPARVAALVNQAQGTLTAIAPTIGEVIDLTGDGLPEAVFEEFNQRYLFSVNQEGTLTPLTMKKEAATAPVIFNMVVQANGATEGYNLLPEANGFYRFSLVPEARGAGFSNYRCGSFEAYQWEESEKVFIENETLRLQHRALVCPP